MVDSIFSAVKDNILPLLVENTGGSTLEIRTTINILELERTLETKTGLKVSITNKKNNSGKLSFEYKDLDQLEFITKLIKTSN